MDSDSGKELEAISNFLIAAKKEGLLVECVWSYTQSIASRGESNLASIQAAAAEALYEWDI